MPHENGQLTADELEPTEQQLQHGRELVLAGWQSVSNKYCLGYTVGAFKDGIPAKEAVLPFAGRKKE